MMRSESWYSRKYGSSPLERSSWRSFGVWMLLEKGSGLMTWPSMAEEEPGEVMVADARKILFLSLLEMVKSRLRQIEKRCVSYSEFLQICINEASNEEHGIEFSKLLDKSGAVIVLGNTVFLRPQQKGLSKNTSAPSTS